MFSLNESSGFIYKLLYSVFIKCQSLIHAKLISFPTALEVKRPLQPVFVDAFSLVGETSHFIQILLILGVFLGRLKGKLTHFVLGVKQVVIHYGANIQVGGGIVNNFLKLYYVDNQQVTSWPLCTQNKGHQVYCLMPLCSYFDRL